MTTRAGRRDDATAAAALHAASIEEGFLSSLGAPFLARLYRRIVASPTSFLVVVESDGVIDGFAAATDDVSMLYRSFILRDGAAALASTWPRIVRSGPRVLETLRRGGGGGELPKAELLAVAVGPKRRGLGLGRALVEEATAQFRLRGVEGAKVVVAATNEPALRLYTACGFRPATDVEVHKGTTSKVLVWS